MRASAFRRAGLALLALLVATMGCAALPQPESRAPAPASSLPRVASREELSKCAGLSLYECLRNTRPIFLHDRGGSVTVFVDGHRWGPVTSLRDLGAVDVARARLLAQPEAGMAHPNVRDGAVLEVSLRRRAVR